MTKTAGFGYKIDWRDNGQGKIFEKKAQDKIASLEFGILKRNYYLKFEKRGRKRRRELDAIFIDLPLVILFEMKRIRVDTSVRHIHYYLGKFKNTCYLLEHEERVFFNNEESCGNSHIPTITAATLWQATENPQVEPHLQEELGIIGNVIWKHALVVPNKVINSVNLYASSHNGRRKIDVDVVPIRQVKNYIKSLYL